VLVGPRTGASEWIVLTHCTDTRPHCAWWGNGAPDCFEMVLGGSQRISDNVGHILVGTYHGCCSRAVTRGLDRHVLDDVNARSLAGFVWESFAWVRYTGFTDGSLPMGSIPGARTGDGRFHGYTFLGGLLIFFLGGRGRGRGAPGCVLLRSFRRTSGLQTVLFVLYIIC
jgi:hypothetical protein